MPVCCAGAERGRVKTVPPRRVMNSRRDQSIKSSRAMRAVIVAPQWGDASPVTFPPGRARLTTKPLPTGSPTPTKAIGTPRAIGLNISSAHVGECHRNVGRAREKFRQSRILCGWSFHHCTCKVQVLTLPPAQLVKPVQQRGEPAARLSRFRSAHQHDDPANISRPPPRCILRGGADKDDEIPAFHSITYSAWASSAGGILMPSAFAVLRLITSSNLVDSITGRSAGLDPFSIWSICPAARRMYSARLGP